MTVRPFRQYGDERRVTDRNSVGFDDERREMDRNPVGSDDWSRIHLPFPAKQPSSPTELPR